MVDEITRIELTFIKINNLTFFNSKILQVSDILITFALVKQITIKIGGNWYE